MLRTTEIAVAAALVCGCNLLKPRVNDETIDAAADASKPKYVLPPGTVVPSIADNAELTSQIKAFDGLNDAALAANGGVVARGTGKAAGVTVRFWNFGPAAIVDGVFVASAPLYVLADDDGNGGFTPRTDHPLLIDSIPGDPRYSAIRRVIFVPVTAMYAGELLTTSEAIDEAFTMGLIREPVPAGTWRNMPVVPPGTQLDVGGTAVPPVPLPATQVFGRGYLVDLFALGGALGIQPLRNNIPPGGQESRLLSGVATGMPPVLPTTLDLQPVFQFGIPAAPPTTTFNYTPIVTELDVRLATGI